MNLTREQIDEYDIPNVEIQGWDDQELLNQSVAFLNPLLKKFGVELHIMWDGIRQVHTIAVLPVNAIVK